MIGGLRIDAADLDTAVRAARRLADGAKVAVRKQLARIQEPLRPHARAFFVVGCQRSGTSMLARSIARSPYVDLYNENDGRAFEHIRIRSTEVTHRLVRSSRARVVVFKPICDSQNLPRLLLDHNFSKAAWLYRSVDGVARSSVRAWGDHFVHAVRTVLTNPGQATWYAESVGPARLQQLQDLARRPLTPLSGAALFWLMRNSLYVDLNLARDPRVMLVRYEDILQSPDATLGSVLDFAGLEWHPDVSSQVRRPNTQTERSVLDPKIATACQDLLEQLEDLRLNRPPAASHLSVV